MNPSLGSVVAAAGSDESAVSVVSSAGAAVESDVEELESALPEPEGLILELTGRVMWSVGLMRGASVVVIGGRVVVPWGAETTGCWIGWVWFMESPGSGWRTACSASMHSPQRVSFQSTRDPVYWLLSLSLTMIVQSPTPSSPLLRC